jgi:hypothetical protein
LPIGGALNLEHHRILLINTYKIFLKQAIILIIKEVMAI